MMTKGRYRHLPIVDEAGGGEVMLLDALYLAHLVSQPAPPATAPVPSTPSVTSFLSWVGSSWGSSSIEEEGFEAAETFDFGAGPAQVCSIEVCSSGRWV